MGAYSCKPYIIHICCKFAHLQRNCIGAGLYIIFTALQFSPGIIHNAYLHFLIVDASLYFKRTCIYFIGCFPAKQRIIILYPAGK